jgi:DNA polymerase delta subunit 2
VKLAGAALKDVPLVTGVIMACLGLEASNGEFQVVDVCFAGMAPNARTVYGLKGEEKMNVNGEQGTCVSAYELPAVSHVIFILLHISVSSSRERKGKWVALVSGLDLSSNDVPPGEEDAADIRLQMLIEYFKGESGGAEERSSSMECSALFILGNSLDVPRRSADDAKNAVSLICCPSWRVCAVRLRRFKMCLNT